MKKTLKILLVALLLVMSVPYVSFANDEDAVEEGFVPYSPAPPQDWTQDQWRQWGLALEMCLIPALDSAQALVADARAILAEAGIIVGVPSEAKVSYRSLQKSEVIPNAFASIVVPVVNLNIDLTPAQIAALQALINEYEGLYERIQNFLYEFENTEMDFEFAITRIYDLCNELLLLNSDLEDALKDIRSNDPGVSDPGSSGGNQADPPVVKTPERPGGGETPQTPEQTPSDQQPTLPQTGTAVALTGIGSGIALTAIGVSTAYLKKKKK